MGTSGKAAAVFACLAAAAFADRRASAFDLPDGAVLLQATSQARKDIKTGEISATIRLANYKWGKPSVALVEATFAFDGVRRSVEQRQWSYRVGGKGKDAKADYERIQAEQLDAEEAVARGLSSKRFDTIRSAYDGSRLCQFTTDADDTNNAARYREYKQGTTDFTFDPRMFGLTDSYNTTTELANVLSTRGFTTVVARETVANHPACYVTVIGKNGYAWHVWVGDTAPFRVYKIQWAIKAPVVEVVIESEYDHGVQHPFPTRVRTQYKLNGKLDHTTDATLTKVVVNRPVDPHVGTIRSLKLPPGRGVDDNATGVRLGYWNGTDISPDISTSLAAAQKSGIKFTPPSFSKGSEDDFMPTPVRPSRTWTPWTWALGGLAVAVAAIVLYYRRRT